MKNYPKRDDRGDFLYVKYPIMITFDVIRSAFNQNLVCAPSLVEGGYVAVNVMGEGYSIPHMARSMPDYQQCKKSCDIHNNWAGYTSRQVKSIVSKSMGL